MIVHDHSRGGLLALQLQLGGDRNFCYLFADRATGEGAVVDPGFAPERLAALAGEQGVRLTHLLITHGHGDHVGGAAALAAATGAVIHAGPQERVAGAEPVAEGEVFALGAQRLLAFHTPGHTPGHFCYLAHGLLCTGDLLFCGKVGGTGRAFPGSSAETEWTSLRRLLTLPDETVVLPGHDYWGGEGRRPFSTIGFERAHNPFLLGADFAAFTDLKDNWVRYKREHGIR